MNAPSTPRSTNTNNPIEAEDPRSPSQKFCMDAETYKQLYFLNEEGNVTMNRELFNQLRNENIIPSWITDMASVKFKPCF